MIQFKKKITNTNIKYNYKGIEHKTHNYIDDSNIVISFKEHSHVKHYLEEYYLLLHEFYNINKLKINPDKTKILIINQNKLDNIFKISPLKPNNIQ